MEGKRVSLGFDLRVSPDLQLENPSQQNQRLVPRLGSPISADSSVWLAPEEVESLTEGILPDFANPLHLAKRIDQLIEACRKKGMSPIGLWPVCLTSFETNLVALNAQFGLGYFDNPEREEDLLSCGWRLMGFDVVDLKGLTSGLKGCGYVEPTWSALRNFFAGALNEIGLFRDSMVASQFSEVRGLQINEHSPFVVVGVLARDPIV
jgi:hypothetical protein